MMDTVVGLVAVAIAFVGGFRACGPIGTVMLSVADAQPAAFVAVTVSVTVPDVFTLKVIAFDVELPVIAPFVMDHS